MPQITKIVTIGWRAMEAEFLNMLKSGLAIEQELLVVSGDDRGANETLANLKRSVGAYGETIVPTYGFTGLINNLGYLQNFLDHVRPQRVALSTAVTTIPVSS